MKAKNLLGTLFILLLTFQLAYGQQQVIQSGSTWVNQRGSTLAIESVGTNGLIKGYYVNRASGTGCQNVAYDLTGWIHGNAITFTVNWDNQTASCNSITSWTGFYYGGQITTLWQLVVNGTTSTSQILKGEDTFSPSTDQKVFNKSLIIE